VIDSLDLEPCSTSAALEEALTTCIKTHTNVNANTTYYTRVLKKSEELSVRFRTG